MRNIDSINAETSIEFAQSKEVAPGDISEIQYLVIDGLGAPGGEDFQNAVNALYGVAYTIQSRLHKKNVAENSPVMPVEGLWWTDVPEYWQRTRREQRHWRVMIKQSDFITQELVSEAIDHARTKSDASALKHVVLLSGTNVLPPHLMSSLFPKTFLPAARRPVAAGPRVESTWLTKREEQVIELIADGMTNKEISGSLLLSIFTVKSHIHEILKKLTLRNRLQIANYAQAHKHEAATVDIAESVPITKREREVLILIAEGLTNKEIAATLLLSTYTVKSHVHNILERLALHNRFQIANYAHTSKEFLAAVGSVSLLDK